MLTTNTTRPMTDIKKYAKENRPEISSQRRAALADIHRMRKIAGIDDHDDWLNFLSSWGAISCKDLDYNTLQQIRWRLHQITDPEDAKQWKPMLPSWRLITRVCMGCYVVGLCALCGFFKLYPVVPP